jgi:hypothetical protein
MSRRPHYWLFLALLACGPLCAATPSAAEKPAPKPPEPPAWSSVMGSGLLTLPDTHTLAPGHFSAATTLHNRDRDPLGIDLFDYAVVLSAGITPRIEAYAHAVYSRVVVVPDNSFTTPALPPPPLDLVVPRGRALPARPYYAFYAPLPYANGRGDQRFTDFVPGDLTLGAKYRISSPTGRGPGFAVNVDLKLPLSRRYSALESGSGTGGLDIGARVTGEQRFAGFDAVLSASFTYVGSPTLPDHIVIAGDRDAAVVVERLRLPHRLDAAFGLRRPFGRHIALVGEIVGNFELDDQETKILDSAPPVDFLGGFQTRLGGFRLTAGVLYHGRALRDGDEHPSPLAGYVDLSRATAEDISDYLVQSGLGGAARNIRPDVQIAAPVAPGVPIPPGARRIPDTYTISSQHQTGFVIILGWTF